MNQRPKRVVPRTSARMPRRESRSVGEFFGGAGRERRPATGEKELAACAKILRSFVLFTIHKSRFTPYDSPVTSHQSPGTASLSLGSFEEHFPRGLNSVERRWESRVHG